MPYAVTHILVPIVLLSIFRDFYLKKKTKKKFPLHYVLIAGLGGVLPDIDILLSIILNFFGIKNWDIHRTFTHSIYFPIFLFVLFILFYKIDTKARICNLTRHKLKLSYIFLFISIGTIIHIFLDYSFGTELYLYLIRVFPLEIRRMILSILDGILLVIWIVYLELK